MTRDNNPIRRANNALQVVNNPEFKQVFNELREAAISDLESLALDGTNDAKAVRLVQRLQETLAVKRKFKELVMRGEREAKREDAAEKRGENKLFDPHALPPTDKGND